MKRNSVTVNRIIIYVNTKSIRYDRKSSGLRFECPTKYITLGPSQGPPWPFNGPTGY